MFAFFCLVLLLQHSLYYAAEQKVPFSGQTVKFALTGNPFQASDLRTISAPLETANAFDDFKGMIEDLGSDYDIPFAVNNAPIGNVTQPDIITSINTLFTYVGESQSYKPESRYTKEAIDERKKIYQNSPLSNVLLGITYASEYKLDQGSIGNLVDIYIEKLFATSFTGLVQDQLLALPSTPDLDKLVAKRLMYTVLNKKYYVEAYSSEEVEYSVSPARRSKHTKLSLYKPVKKLGPYPILGVLYEWQDKKQGFLVYKNNRASNHSVYAHHEDTPLIALATNGSSLIGISPDGTIGTYTLRMDILHLSINEQLMHSQKILPFNNATAAAIDFNEQGLWCIGCNKSIALFKLNWRYHIKDLQTYDLPTAADGHITHVSMLDSFIAITYRTASNEFEYRFFDMQKQSFIKDHPGRVEIVCKDSKEQMAKKQMVLIRDYQQLINRGFILNARKVTPNDYYDVILDSKQEHIYTISPHRHQDEIRVESYMMFPHGIKPFIQALNICVEKELIEKQHMSLTLDMLYCINKKFNDLAPHMTISNELAKKVSIPMRAAVNPTILNSAINSFLFGNRWLKGAALLGVAGLSALLWYQYRRNVNVIPASPMSSSQKVSYPSAVYKKITSTPQQ